MAANANSGRMVRPPEAISTTQFERVMTNAARGAMIFMALVLLVVVLKVGQVLLAPVWLAMIVGLLFGPAADRFEKYGIPPALSALLVVLLLLAVIAAALLLFAVPLSEWVNKVPLMWDRLRNALSMLKGPLDSLGALQAQVAGIFGESTAMTVRVADGGGTITGLAMIAPAIGGQALLFLASLYFFVATREHIRISILSLCVSRRMRWRTAHIFSDVEEKVSRFLVSVTIINVCVGVAVSVAMWLLHMPSPLLWGALATMVNYVPYVGQAVMVVVLVSVGLGTETGLVPVLLPVGCYLVITFAEGQIVTPHVLGRTMTLNPFLIFLTITFWLWAWGPLGGPVAVPSLLIVQSVLAHVLPSKAVLPRRRVRRTAAMTDRELILANAAQVIREQRAAVAKTSHKVRQKRVPPSGTAPDGSPEVA